MSWEEKAAFFGAFLEDSGVKSTTLRCYFSAIKNILTRDSYHWDDNKVLLSSLIRGCKIKNNVVRTKIPIQGHLLEMLLFEVERKYRKAINRTWRFCTKQFSC